MEDPGNPLFCSESSQSLVGDGTSVIIDGNNENGDEVMEAKPVVLAMVQQPIVQGVCEVVPMANGSSTISDHDLVQFKQEPLTLGVGSEDEGQEFEHQYAAIATNMEEGTEDDVDNTNKMVIGIPGGFTIGANGQILVKEEQQGPAAPQQFIILARSSDGTDGAVKLDEAVPPSSKYMQFEGADGLTYVFAVQDDVSQVPSESNVTFTAQHSQQILPVKNIISGRKGTAGTATIGSSQVSGASLSSSTSSASSSLSSSARGKPGHNASVDGINQAWFTTRDDKNALHNEGLKWKQGQWTKEEVEVLEDNINNYCKEHNIKDPAEVIFERSKEERKDFYRTIALGIQRPLFSVYRRVTRMYDRKNHRGKYTPNEMKTLRSLRAKHGNDWAAIGVALGRSASSVKDKCRLMKDNCNSGKWYPAEEARLAAAVHKLTGVKPSESVTSGLSWAVVADHVGTRSEKQCRTKWLNYLNWKQQGGADWTREDDNLLIDRVSKMNVLNDSEIDWIALSQDWASVRSPQWLRGKWWALKRHIPDYNKLTYTALLEQMKQVIYLNMKPKPGTLRHPKSELDASTNTTAEFLKGVIPVSVGALSDGSLSLTYCQEDEGYQAFEVLQSWTPQILGQTGTDSGVEGAQGILGDNSHIIVQTLGSALGDGMHLNGQQQVIISTTAGLGSQGAGDADITDREEEAMAIQVPGDELVNHSADQDLNVLTSDSLHENTFSTEGEEIVTVTEFHTQVGVEGEQDIMTQDVFAAVTSESGGDLVMGVSSHTAASSLMTSLKDPILMSSSDVDCEKSQSTVLTDEHSELID